ncbi:hypothetical protein VMCG_00705 [Cytospora schulzeri]|uniref:Uncharacterized protein n=1 Tax=Cytospora schulzeri TaxID=448051 RepID=A0A423X7S3_9PEZI|nr:hypothetical protein VMCG_00705 [Valsa malicola]
MSNLPSSSDPAPATGVSSSTNAIVDGASGPPPDQDTPNSTEESKGDDKKGPSVKEPQYNIDDLFEAIQNNQPEKMKQILKACPELLNMRNDPGTLNNLTPKELLDRNKLGNLLTQDILFHQQHKRANLGVQWFGSQRPLHVACVFGKTEPVEILLDWSEGCTIDINSKNGSEETPLGIVCRAAHLRIAKLLLEKSRTLERSQKIQVILEDDLGYTPIHYLAGEGIYPKWTENRDPTEPGIKEIVRSLLEASNYGDNPNQNEFGRFCMEVAARQRSVSLMEILLELAPDSKDLQDEDGWTALHFGAAVGHAEIVQMLLQSGAESEIKTKIPGPYDAAELALEYREYDIAAYIQENSRLKGPADDRFDLQAWVWRGKPRQQDKDTVKLPINKLVGSAGKIRQQLSDADTVWCHLPANNWDWSLCKDASISNYPNLDEIMLSLQQTFDSSSQSPPFCEHCFDFISQKAKADTQAAKADAEGTRAGSDFLNTVMVLPLIDIDLLDQIKLQDEGLPDARPKDAHKQHTWKMRVLYQDKNRELHRPRTLDHYFHKDIDKGRLETLNSGQVLSRYLRKQQDKASSQASGPNEVDNNKHVVKFARQGIQLAINISSIMPLRLAQSTQMKPRV